MSKKNLVLSAILFIALIGTIEFLKSLGHLKLENMSPRGQIDLRGLDTRPFAQRDEESRRGFGLQRVAGRSGHSVIPFGSLTAAQQGTKEPSRLAQNGQPDDSAKKDAKDKAKKKRKKKKNLLDAYLKSKRNLNANSDRNKTRPSNGDPTVLGGGVAALPPRNNPEPPTDDENASEWLTRLLGRPDRNLMMEFIRLYQGGDINISSFYSVVDSLLKQRESDYHILALLAASETPSLRSYDILATVGLGAGLGAGSGGSYGGNTIQLALGYLQTYEFVQLLWVPRTEILDPRSPANQRPNPSVERLTLAATTIERSTVRYLSGADIQEPARRVFSELIPVLERSITIYAGVAAVAGPLQAALDRIRSANLNPPGPAPVRPAAVALIRR
jgi:hypothetical protein